MKPSSLFDDEPEASSLPDDGCPLKSVTLITDGACILRYNHHRKELYGSERQTTNNRMELTAVIRGLRTLNERCRVTIVTDSQYVKNGITQWIHGWKRKGWVTKAKTPVLNKDLWMDLEAQVERHEIHWEWVKGHADHADNNRCDELATEAARNQS